MADSATLEVNAQRNSLWKIAEEAYGDGNLFRHIFEHPANRHAFINNDAGQLRAVDAQGNQIELVIPKIEGQAFLLETPATARPALPAELQAEMEAIDERLDALIKRGEEIADDMGAAARSADALADDMEETLEASAPADVSAPEPDVETQVESSPQPKTHIVQPGESYSKIAQQYGIENWRDIQAANGNIPPRSLPVGQELVIPGVYEEVERTITEDDLVNSAETEVAREPAVRQAPDTQQENVTATIDDQPVIEREHAVPIPATGPREGLARRQEAAQLGDQETQLQATLEYRQMIERGGFQLSGLSSADTTNTERLFSRLGVDGIEVDGTLGANEARRMGEYLRHNGGNSALEHFREEVIALQSHETLSEAQTRSLQTNLSALGYPSGPIDGTWGEQTESALRLFNTIEREEASILEDRAALREWQTALNKAGFNAGGVDGLRGPRTRAAEERANDVFEQYGLPPLGTENSTPSSHHLAVLQAHEVNLPTDLPQHVQFNRGSRQFDSAAHQIWRQRVAANPVDSVALSIPVDAREVNWSSGFGGHTGRMASEHRGEYQQRNWRTGNHEGVDLTHPVAGTRPDITAAASGVVLYSGLIGQYGHTVIIGHDDGTMTLYGHNTENYVEPGTIVERGDKIAIMGGTGVGGREEYGRHLQFEHIRRDNKVIPPVFAGYEDMPLTTDNFYNERTNIADERGNLRLFSGSRRDFHSPRAERFANAHDEAARETAQRTLRAEESVGWAATRRAPEEHELAGAASPAEEEEQGKDVAETPTEPPNTPARDPQDPRNRQATQVQV